jgi:predicted AAA+ superfamily ATPase
MEKLQAMFYKQLKNFNTPYERYFFKKVDFDEKMIGILGDRGIGKTTFLFQYLKKLGIPLSQKLYINAEYIAMSNQNLLDLATEFYEHGGKVIVIDEIHKYPDFETHLKLIYDVLDLRILFSGSNAIKLEHSKADLSRRAVLYRFQGLSFREFLELKLHDSFPTYSFETILKDHIDIVHELARRFKPLEHFSAYRQFGYYPFYFDSTKESFELKLNETINATIEFDLNHIFNIEPKFTIKLKQLVALLCESKPYELNMSKLAQKIGINRTTLYQYIYYLTRGNLFQTLSAKSKGDTIFSKPQKIYLGNTNLYHAYCTHADIGTMREAFFFNQVRHHKKVQYAQQGDFVIDERYTVEIGGKNKSFEQIKDTPDSYIIADDIEIGFGNKIPLWLFGFLY